MQQKGYIKSLDGVRGVAILLVMAFHANLLHFGWMGVQLFFVLSGYLITSILWKDKSQQEALGHKLKRFWFRRSLRIFPLYFTYLIVLGLTFLFFQFPDYYKLYAPYLYTYTVNYSRLLPGWTGNPLFTHLWSLSIEEQFYLFFPFLVFLLPGRGLKVFLVLMVMAAPLIRYGLGIYFSHRAPWPVAADAVYWHTLSHLDAFFLGGLIPVFSLESRFRRTRLVFGIALGLAIVAGLADYLNSPQIASYWTDLGYHHDRVGNEAHVWRYTCLNLLFASLILLLTSSRSRSQWAGRLLESPPLVYVGRVSYGMYIFHWAVLVYVFRSFAWTGSGWIRVALFLPYVLVVYVVAEISYRCYEKPFLRIKDRVFPKKGGLSEPLSSPKAKASKDL